MTRNGEQIINHNARIVDVKVSRIELCDIMIALTMTSNESDAEKWDKLHEKLRKQLEHFDDMWLIK